MITVTLKLIKSHMNEKNITILYYIKRMKYILQFLMENKLDYISLGEIKLS